MARIKMVSRTDINSAKVMRKTWRTRSKRSPMAACIDPVSPDEVLMASPLFEEQILGPKTLVIGLLPQKPKGKLYKIWANAHITSVEQVCGLTVFSQAITAPCASS